VKYNTKSVSTFEFFDGTERAKPCGPALIEHAH